MGHRGVLCNSFGGVSSTVWASKVATRTQEAKLDQPGPSSYGVAGRQAHGSPDLLLIEARLQEKREHIAVDVEPRHGRSVEAEALPPRWR